MADYAFNYAKSYMRAHNKRLKWFSGALREDSIENIAECVQAVGAKRLLDFGSGKGYQYLRQRAHEGWGGILPHCYDIGVWQLKEKPRGKFDGVICTDVMEHIHPDDVGGLLTEIFSYLELNSFAYFDIFCNPASKKFPDGTNVHLTVRKPEWWEKELNKYRRNGLLLWADYEYSCGDDFQSEEL